MIHLIGIPVVFVAGIFVGYKFGARAVTKVRTELAHVEAEIRAGFSHTATSVLSRIHRIL
jgi:hypothetical protein